MTTDEIKLALRLVAMGRVNHPQVDELAEALAGVFSRKCEPLPVVRMPAGEPVQWTPESVVLVSEEFNPSVVTPTVETTPKRRKKAD